jgi:hypothetical protein
MVRLVPLWPGWDYHWRQWLSATPSSTKPNTKTDPGNGDEIFSLISGRCCAAARPTPQKIEKNAIPMRMKRSNRGPRPDRIGYELEKLKRNCSWRRGINAKMIELGEN